MKLTWKSRTLIEVRWPWMSKKRHHQLLGESVAAMYAESQNAVRVITEVHEGQIANINADFLRQLKELQKKRNAEVRIIRKDCRGVLRECHKKHNESKEVIKTLQQQRQQDVKLISKYERKFESFESLLQRLYARTEYWLTDKNNQDFPCPFCGIPVKQPHAKDCLVHTLHDCYVQRGRDVNF